MKAIVAVEHSILTAAWHMLADGECMQILARTTSSNWTHSKPR